MPRLVGDDEAPRIAESVRYTERNRARSSSKGQQQDANQQGRILYVQLNSGLSAASPDALTGQNSAMADVLERDPSTGNLSDSGRDISVVNRSDVTYQFNHPGLATWVNGEWLFHPLECP